MAKRPSGFLYYVVQTIRASRRQGVPLADLLKKVPTHAYVELGQGDYNAVCEDGVERGVSITFVDYEPLAPRATNAEIFAPVLNTLFDNEEGDTDERQ